MYFRTASISAALVLSAMSTMALPALPASAIETVEGLPHSGTHGMGAPQEPGVPPKAVRDAPLFSEISLVFVSIAASGRAD